MPLPPIWRLIKMPAATSCTTTDTWRGITACQPRWVQTAVPLFSLQTKHENHHERTPTPECRGSFFANNRSTEPELPCVVIVMNSQDIDSFSFFFVPSKTIPPPPAGGHSLPKTALIVPSTARA